MKKIIALLLLVVMALSLVSCGGSEDDGIVITWLVPGDAQKDTKLVVEEINKILEPELGVKLDLQYIAQSAYGEKMKMNMASGMDYDICFTSAWLNIYEAAARDGGLYDITDLISDDLRAVLDEADWEAAKVDGRIYAVPNNQIMTKQYAIGFREDLVEKYKDQFDINSVKEIKDIEPFLEIVKKNEPTLFGYNNAFSTSVFTQGIFATPVDNTGVTVRMETGEIVRSHEQTETIEAQNLIREWYKKGYIRQVYAAGGDGGPASAEVQQGKYAVKFEQWKPGLEQLQTGVRYKFVPIGNPVRIPPTNTMTAVGANSKHPEEAMKVIEFFNTNKEVYNLISYGIEGKHYDFNDEGKMVIKENTGYTPQGDWKFGCQFNAYITEGMPDDVWEQTKKVNAEAIVPPTQGFVFNSDPVKNELAQIASVYAEYVDYVTIPEKEYASWCAKKEKALMEAGYEKVYKEIEKQLKEYWKKTGKKY